MRLSVSLAALTALAVAPLRAETAFVDGHRVVPGRIIVRTADPIPTDALARVRPDAVSTGHPVLDSIVAVARPTAIKPLAPARRLSPRAVPVYVLKVAEGADLPSILADLNRRPGVVYAEPDYLTEAHRLYRKDRPWRPTVVAQPLQGTPPDDPIFYDPSKGINRYDNPDFQWTRIKALEAWEITMGDSTVPIAIIDSGVDWGHPDLAANIWTNDDEVPGGADTDGNGYPGDVRGWDFIDGIGADANEKEDGEDQDNDPSDVAGHGTACAGLTAAAVGNGIGVAGVAGKCEIMPIRAGYLSSEIVLGDYQTYILMSAAAAGLYYAADNGAAVANMSWGSLGQTIIDAALYADAAGVVLAYSAGNENGPPTGVLAFLDETITVAATAGDDSRAYFTNYGPEVDLSAPGVNLITTDIHGIGGYNPLGDYTNKIGSEFSGTSASAPVVAGGAALVRSLHPDWSSARVRQQLMATADTSIYAVNDSVLYRGALGAGRIDVYRAVTESAPVLIQAVEFTPSDAAGGDGDGMLEPGETIDIRVTLKSFLKSLSGISAVLETKDPYVTLLDRESVFPAWAADSTASNVGDLFRVRIATNAPPSHTADLFLVIADGGGTYRRTELHPILILPLYGNHDIGNVKLTVTSFGALGFYDYINETAIGSGFEYPIGAPSHLFHGSLMAGIPPDRVSDVAYGDENSFRLDWVVESGGVLDIGGAGRSDQDGTAVYNDSGGFPPIGLKVTQTSMAFKDKPDDDYVMLEYLIQNKSGGSLNGLYVGLYMDWDFEDSQGNAADETAYDASNRLGYMFGPGSDYYGISLLNQDAAGYRAVSNQAYVYPGFTDENKYLFMSGGFGTTASDAASDWSQLLSAGPFNLGAGAEVRIAFAVLGGEKLTDLKASAAAAASRYLTRVEDREEEESALPRTLALGQNYPNPFNSSTLIPFSLPEAGEVFLDIYNLSGQRVRRLVADKMQPGNHRVIWDGRDDRGGDVPSGVYLARLKGLGQRQVVKILYLK